MRLFQATLDTPLDNPFSATLSVHGLHFTVYAPSILGCQRLQSPALRNPGFHKLPPGPSPKTPHPAPQNLPLQISLHSAMHSYTFPYKEGRVVRDLEGGFWGDGKRGWRFMKTRGFRFLNPGFRNLRGY